MPRVENNITRTEAIQLDLGRRCICLIPQNSLRIPFRKRPASNLIAATLIVRQPSWREDAEKLVSDRAKETAVKPEGIVKDGPSTARGRF
jgi:hypothetical protein